MKLRFVFCLFLIFILNSCSLSVSYLKVLNGYYKAQKGDYQNSLLLYLDAKKTKKFLPWINYNIANIYQEFGENESALAVYDSLNLEHDDIDLLYSVNFNKGVAYYGLGKYKEAKNSFLKALFYKNNDLAAKKNLELSINKIKSFFPTKDYKYDESKEEEKDNDKKEDNSFISKKNEVLDYIKYKEEKTWITNQKLEKKTDPYQKDW